MARKKPCPCGQPTLPGLVPSVSLCQTHFNSLMYRSGPEHREAVAMLYKSRLRRS